MTLPDNPPRDGWHRTESNSILDALGLGLIQDHTAQAVDRPMSQRPSPSGPRDCRSNVGPRTPPTCSTPQIDSPVRALGRVRLRHCAHWNIGPSPRHVRAIAPEYRCLSTTRPVRWKRHLYRSVCDGRSTVHPTSLFDRGHCPLRGHASVDDGVVGEGLYQTLPESATGAASSRHHVP